MLITNGEGGLSVRLKLNDLIQKLFYSGRSYSKRSDFVTDVSAGYSPIDGTIVTAAGYQYQALAGVADISDLPGFVPYKEITPIHFGAPWDGLGDDGPAVQAAIEYGLQQMKAEITLPFGVGRFDTQAVVSTNVDYRHLTIRGAGKATVLRSHNSDGCIKITCTTRRTFFEFVDFDMAPMIEGSGTAIECTSIQGGTQGRRGVELRNIALTPEDYTNSGTAFWNDVLILKGWRRPRIDNVVHFDPNGTVTIPTRFAICNIDGCYFPHVTDCYFNGVAQRSISNDQEDLDGDGGAVTREANEGGYFINTVMNGGDIGLSRTQDGRDAGLWIFGCHVNATTIGMQFENTKYATVRDSLMYSRNTSETDYIDFKFITCNNIRIEANKYRGENADRRHVYLQECYDIYVNDSELAADVDVPPYYADANCENCLFIVPKQVTARDSASYPDQLVEVAAGATDVVWYRGADPASDSSRVDSVVTRYGANTVDGTDISRREYLAETSTGVMRSYAIVDVTSNTVTNGAEDGGYTIFTRVNGALQRALSLSKPAVSGNTSIVLLSNDGSAVMEEYRVKVGANGTGPGGVGRALYIDDTA